MKPVRVLTIAGSDSGGGAGIQADLKTITVLGGFGMSVITALTAQNTLGVQGVHDIPLDFIEKQFDSVMSDIGTDAAKTGMLATASVIEIVSANIRKYSIEKLVVDPVMVAKGGELLVRGDFMETLIKKLIPLALVVTPNLPEAKALTGFEVASVDDMKKAALHIFEFGAKNVVIKGGHLDGDAVDILYDGRKFYYFPSKRIGKKGVHGTGCTFSAAIATEIAGGQTVFNAVKRAKEYITDVIKFACTIGGGHEVIYHFSPISRKLESQRCIDVLRSALQRLLGEKCGCIIPEVQSNIVYALPSAASKDDVAAVPGRIIRVGDRAEILCEPTFGASQYMAEFIVSALKHDKNCRSGMNIRYSKNIEQICRDLGYNVDYISSANKLEERKHDQTFLLASSIEGVFLKKGIMPDMIIELANIGKEQMIIILGKDPEDIVDKVLNILGAMKKIV